MSEAGWIKLYRSSLDHWLYTEYRPLTRREAWETILLTVNYESTKVLIKGQIYECKPGQSLLSLESWAKEFVWSIQQVRTFFKLLESDGMITTDGLQYTTRLTVCNWDSYQGVSTDQKQTKNRPKSNQQQSANKPLTTIKEGEESKEGKEDIWEKSNRFLPPSISEIESYCIERKNAVDANKFFDFYQSKGWMVGKNKMKDWKAAVRNWEKTQNYGSKTNANIGRATSIHANNEELFCGIQK